MDSTDQQDDSFILFQLAGTTYAVSSAVVQQIEMIDHITPVPNAAAFVDGVVFARGQVVPVINLRARFGFERIANSTKTRLIVIAFEGRTIGLLVDAANEFARLPTDAIKPPPEAITGLSSKYLSGVATVGDRLILVLQVGEALDFHHLELPSNAG
jgi:purine-binding chemotaxis protein CheW